MGANLFALASPVVERLKALGQSELPIAAMGPAMVSGALLALRAGMADDARVLLARAAEAKQFFLSHVPKMHRATAEALPWVEQASRSRLSSESGGAQLGDVETLLRALGKRDGFRGLLNQVLDLLLLWTGVERGMLLLRAPGGKLVVRAARNLNKSDLSDEQRRLSFSMAERAMKEGRAVVAVDAVADLPSVHRSVHSLNLRSVLAVPLAARGEVLGVAYLDDRVRRAAFGERELSWAKLIGTVAALAIADERDRLQLRRTLWRAQRAEAKVSERLHHKEAALELATRELSRIREDRKLRGDYSDIIFRSRAMGSLLEVVDRVAQSDVPALVQGESGTGKELIAQAIAEVGLRKGKPFIAENCGAIPEGLMESTLFGHVRGAFTGATKNQDGLFVLAHGGTLFLDEIGEMPLTLQTKLLRVLQEGQVRPLGAPRNRPVDVRLIAATNRDLQQLVREGRFREDLYYRLNVVRLRIPPLRERPDDIEPLVEHFLTIHGGGRTRQLSAAALSRLCSYSWPGNVRQLENEVRRMVVLGGEELTTADLSPEIMADSSETPLAITLRDKVDALERRLVVEALEQTKGNRTKAAEKLGVSRFGLQKMTQRLGIGQSSAMQKPGRIKDRGLDD
jgi:transcriptional regulator with GAF, ATPase, and Fis domain